MLRFTFHSIYAPLAFMSGSVIDAYKDIYGKDNKEAACRSEPKENKKISEKEIPENKNTRGGCGK